MNKAQVTVSMNGTATVIDLALGDKVSQIRRVLTERELMTGTAAFLFRGNPLAKSAEKVVTLGELLNGEDELAIREMVWGAFDSRHAVTAWAQLGTSLRQELVKQTGLRRGLVIHEFGGVGRSSQVPVSWDLDALSFGKPSSMVETITQFSLSEIARDLAIMGVREAHLPLFASWYGPKSEDEYQKKRAKYDNPLKAFLLGKHYVKKVVVNVAVEQMRPTPQFMDVLGQAVGQLQDSLAGYENLIKVFNLFGYYIASQVTLGGALFQQTDIKFRQWCEIRSSFKSFSAEFQHTLANIGTCALYRSGKAPFPLFQMGGVKNTHGHYGRWIHGLEDAYHWVVITYEKCLPTLALIGQQDMAMGNACFNLLNKYASYNEVQHLQAVIDMKRYAGEAKRYFLNPI
ncbi:MAG: hypothetical protein MI862_12575 [Desulfobacterales bacterium]|nr:hypothetical protein [Desulfobacterales bacterium]